MITISTGDLLGLLGDAIPFALDVDEVPHVQCVRLEWDGGMLHAQTTDLYRIGWASWHPDDVPVGGAQDDLWADFGGTDDPWSVLIPLAAAKELLTNYKLPQKRWRTPLTVDLVDGQLTVKRAAAIGHTTLTTVIEEHRSELEFPDIRAVLAKADTVGRTSEVSYNPSWLADFASVRGGPMDLTFTGKGGKGVTLITIGRRFVGAIRPELPPKPPAVKP